MLSGWNILDCKEYDKEFNLLISLTLKQKLFDMVTYNNSKNHYVNKKAVNQMLVNWQQNITEHEQNNQH